MWKSRIQNPKDKELFDAMKDIINGKNPQINYDELFDSFDSNKKLNPKRLNEIIPPLNYTLDQIVDHANEREKLRKAPSFHVGGQIINNNSMDKLYKLNIIDNRAEEVKEYIVELEGGVTLKMNNLKEFNKNLNKGYMEISGKKLKIMKIEKQ